jgi:hypothetical protein
LGLRVIGRLIDLGKDLLRCSVVAPDQRPPQAALAGEVVVDARRPDADLLRDVGIAEGVAAARLGQLMGHIEDAGCDIASFMQGCILPSSG